MHWGSPYVGKLPYQEMEAQREKQMEQLDVNSKGLWGCAGLGFRVGQLGGCVGFRVYGLSY